MSQIVQTHNTAHVQVTKKKRDFSFLNVVRSIFTEFSAVVIMVFLANKLHEGNVSTAFLIGSIGTGVVLGTFVVFHLYIGKKAH